MIRVEGPNFAVEEFDGGIAVVKMWRRPDLSRDEGVRCAQLIADPMERLSRKARGCLFSSEPSYDLLRPSNSPVGAKDDLGVGSAAKPICVVHARDAIDLRG